MRKKLFREFERAWPEVVERFGVLPAAPRKRGWAYYCRRCELYFTRNVDGRGKCPICGCALRRRKGGEKRYIDPADYGVEVR